MRGWGGVGVLVGLRGKLYLTCVILLVSLKKRREDSDTKFRKKSDSYLVSKIGSIKKVKKNIISELISDRAGRG